MGLFDLFKKKENEKTEPQENKTREPYLGDLNKTNAIFHLVQVPQADRDEQWQHSLLENLPEASFRCGNPQVVSGPDGFPYFQLLLPEPYQNFQCFVIDKMKDDFLLANGYGVVINPTAENADWVLSYGDILNFHLTKTFYTKEQTAFSKKTGDETIREEEKVMIGQPSETILPRQTRKLISDFLKTNGIPTPKVLLMMRHVDEGKEVSQDIVFNISPQSFDTEKEYQKVMQTIAWYLPRHYSFVGMDEKTLGDSFMLL